MKNLERKYKILIYVFIGIVCLFLVYKIYFENSQSEYDAIVNQKQDYQNIVEEDEDIMFVHVSGAVKNPGLIELKVGQRVNDAINKAGGITENGNLDYINLAQKVEDGSKIYIPTNEEINLSEAEMESIENTTFSNGINANTNDGDEIGKININKASKEELSKLPRNW